MKGTILILVILISLALTFSSSATKTQDEVIEVIDAFTFALENVDVEQAMTLMPDLRYCDPEGVAEDMELYNNGRIIEVIYPTESWDGYMDAFVIREYNYEIQIIKYILYSNGADNTVVINYLFDDNTRPFD